VKSVHNNKQHEGIQDNTNNLWWRVSINDNLYQMLIFSFHRFYKEYNHDTARRIHRHPLYIIDHKDILRYTNQKNISFYWFC